MICDNCNVKHFTLVGRGEVASVEFMSIEGDTSEPEVGEVCDLTAQQLVRFEELHPYTFSQKVLKVKNVTNVELPFSWNLVQPHLVCPDVENPDSAVPPSSRTLDVDPTFNIEPTEGVLGPNAVSEYLITYAPAEVKKHHSVLHLVLHNVADVDGNPEGKINVLVYFIQKYFFLLQKFIFKALFIRNMSKL